MQEAQVNRFDDEEKKMAYMREVLAFLSSCDPDLSAPALVKPLSRIYEKYWGKRDSMEEVKQEFNDYLLSMKRNWKRRSGTIPIRWRPRSVMPVPATISIMRR